jgi:hypothetical protein
MEEEGMEEEQKILFFRQDVKALHPSLKAKETGKIVEKVINESKIEWEDMDKEHLKKLVAIMLTKTERQEMEIEEILSNKVKKGAWKTTMKFLDKDVHRDSKNK